MLSSALFHFSNKQTGLHPTQVPGAEENELEQWVTHIRVRSVETTAVQPIELFCGVSGYPSCKENLVGSESAFVSLVKHLALAVSRGREGCSSRFPRLV